MSFKRTVHGIELNLGNGLKEGVKDGQSVVQINVGDGLAFDAAGELGTPGGGASPGILGNYEVISSGALDLTKGHHILNAGGFYTLGPGSVDREFHTIYADTADSIALGMAAVTVSGTVDPNFSLHPARFHSHGVQWNAAASAWIQKVYSFSPNPSTLVTFNNLRDYFDLITYSGPSLVGSLGVLKVNFIQDGVSSIARTDGSGFFVAPGTLSQNSQVTLDVTGCTTGEAFKIVRYDSGAFTLAIINGGVGGGTLYTFPASTVREATFRFDGTNFTLLTHARLEPSAAV